MRKQRFRKDDLSHPFRGKIMARIQSPFCSRQCSWQRAAPLGPQMAWFHKMPPRGFQVIWWQVAYWNGVLLTRSSVSHTKKIIRCYGLNVCIVQNSYIEVLTPNVLGDRCSEIGSLKSNRERLSKEGGALMMRMMRLVTLKEEIDLSLSLFLRPHSCLPFFLPHPSPHPRCKQGKAT